MAELEEGLRRRAEAAERRRDAFASLMKDVYRFAMPERDAWRAYGYGGDRQVDVYDSTAVIATGRFANRLQQALFPPQQRWAQLALPPELAAADDGGLARDLEAATDLLFAQIHSTNFDQAVNEWALDLAAGVGCLLIENGRLATRRPGAPLLRFQAVPAAQVAFDEGPWGTVEGVFFAQRLPARLLRRTYPDATLPRRLAELERNAPEEAVELLQATVFDPEADRWRMVVAERGQHEVLAERFFRSCPWVVTRWSKSPGETYGRGPLASALPDIRVLNKLKELMLAAASLDVYGVWTVADDGVVNPATVRIAPGALVPVRANAGPLGPSIAPLRTGANYQLAEVLMEQLGTQIRQTLFDQPLPPEVQTGITATEIIERIRLFQQDTGAFGRLQADAVAPIVLRCLDILEEAGQLAGPRFGGLMEAVRRDAVRIRAVSPLAQAQDRADVQAVVGFLSAATAMGQMGAAVVERGVDMDRLGPWLATRMGVPADLIPTAEELAERARAAEEAQAAQAAMGSPVLAQAVGNLAPVMTGGGE